VLLVVTLVKSTGDDARGAGVGCGERGRLMKPRRCSPQRSNMHILSCCLKPLRARPQRWRTAQTLHLAALSAPLR
jgi:hypothetical protein